MDFKSRRFNPGWEQKPSFLATIFGFNFKSNNSISKEQDEKGILVPTRLLLRKKIGKCGYIV